MNTKMMLVVLLGGVLGVSKHAIADAVLPPQLDSDLEKIERICAPELSEYNRLYASLQPPGGRFDDDGLADLSEGDAALLTAAGKAIGNCVGRVMNPGPRFEQRPPPAK